MQTNANLTMLMHEVQLRIRQPALWPARYFFSLTILKLKRDFERRYARQRKTAATSSATMLSSPSHGSTPSAARRSECPFKHIIYMPKLTLCSQAHYGANVPSHVGSFVLIIFRAS